MHLKLNSFLKITGMVTLITCLAMLPAYLVSMIYGEGDAAAAFFIPMMVGLFIGSSLTLFFNKSIDYLRVSDGFLIVFFAWALASSISAIPYYLTGAIPDYIDAFFESCSGLSTTGATVIDDIEVLPKSILFWRSFTEWLGGIGILMLAVSIMPSLGISGQDIIAAEAPSPMLDKTSINMSTTAKTIIGIYIFCTIAEAILLKFAGMGWFDAVTHTFGTVSTGGFSNYNDNIAHFTGSQIKIIISIFMFICGTNFNLFYMTLRSGPSIFLRDGEFRLYAAIIAFFSIFSCVLLLATNEYDNLHDAGINSVFQITSIVTTSGFTCTDYMGWPAISQLILLCMMFVGGCSSSTGGGIKVIRILIIIKLIKRSFKIRLHNKNIGGLRLNGAPLTREATNGVISFTFLYIFMVFAGAILVAFDNIDMVTTFTSVISCLGNIGPGFNAIGPSETYSVFSSFSKFILSICMIAGRIELYALYIILMPNFWRRDY